MEEFSGELLDTLLKFKDVEERRILVIDVSNLPQEYQKETVKESIEKYVTDFKLEYFKVVPIDTSRQNITTPPVQIIK